MTEISESFVEVEEENLKVRVEYIRSKLLESSVMLRGNIPEGLSDQDLTENNVFKQWVVCNTVYEASMNDTENAGINRMFYYMFDTTKGDLPSLLSHYDVDIELSDDGKLTNVNLIILEPETSDE